MSSTTPTNQKMEQETPSDQVSDNAAKDILKLKADYISYRISHPTESLTVEVVSGRIDSLLLNRTKKETRTIQIK